MNKSISMKIRELRKERKLTQQQVADAIGISRVAVSKWESGETKDLKRDSLIGLSALFGVSLNELLDAESLVKEEPNVTYGIKLHSDRRGYPIISPVQAGHWREIVDTFPRGGADEYILASNTYSAHTFALRITGNSMEPEFKEGDVVVIDPDVRPSPGDYVVAKNHDEAATFKKYRPRGIMDGQEVFELVPLNEDYAIMRSDQQPIQIIGTMMEHTRYRR
jgi:SOS-response transcriptional repressor LexA